MDKKREANNEGAFISRDCVRRIKVGQKAVPVQIHIFAV
jgi:hypothetical protein